MAFSASHAENVVLPFQVESAGLRGRFVRLGPLLTDVLSRHDYPEPVSRLLAELTVLTALLGSALKYDGVFTLQTNAKGPVSILVADMTSDGTLRAYAQFDRDRLSDMTQGPDLSPVPGLLGEGHLAFTVDQGQDTERYQGVVSLEGQTLTDCIHHYFRQSEQIDAAIKTAVFHAEESNDWQGGAIMVQRLPEEGPDPEAARADNEESWREAVTLMGSARSEELTDATLSPDRLLYRLFHEPGVRAFAPHGLAFGCRCSRERVERTLAAFPEEEIMDLMVDGVVDVKCEFCGKSYVLDAGDLRALFGGDSYNN